MNYSDYRPYDMVNGNGVRATLFVSGCSHGCKGCYNTVTWNPKAGTPYSKDLEDRLIADLKGVDGVERQGLTLTGGDPLHKSNLNVIEALCKRVREECPDKDIWLWSGYTKDEVLSNPELEAVIRLVDYFIDGKFEQDKHDPRLLYRGSSNQNVYKHLERIL